MSLINDMEDEDVTLYNSPLNQYLSDINFENGTQMEKIADHAVIPSNQISLNFAYYVFKIFNIILNYCFSRNIRRILNYAMDVNFLDEDDEMCLKYLLNTQSIQSDSSSEKSTPPLSTKCVGFIIIALCCLMILNLKLIIPSIVCLCICFLLHLMLLSYMIKYATMNFYDRLVTISKHSRRTILQIQELLSINQGYDRVVHIKENEHYDCSKSFNSKFLRELSTNVINILSNLIYRSHEWNNQFQNVTGIHIYCPPEIPWLQENNDLSPDYLTGNHFDLDHPIYDLKTLHNLVQIQFTFSIKRTVLLIYCLPWHYGIQILKTIAIALRQCNTIISELNRCSKLLEYKIKSNLTNDHTLDTAKLSDSDVKVKLILNSIRSMELHLFEISEFTLQFKERLSNNDIDTENRLAALNKCRTHINSLNNCWETMQEETKDFLCKERMDIKETELLNRNLSQYEENDGKNEHVVLCGEQEILDEVLEGVPFENDKGNEDLTCFSDLDTFVEKSKRNANCLLNELKSVIEVRAEDWKKREKEALKRRAAEGKFVFDGMENEELKVRQDSELTNMDTVGNAETIVRDVCCDMDGIDFDLRSELSQMILRQRHTMLLNADANVAEEECFGD